MDELQEYRIQLSLCYLEHVRTIKRKMDAAIELADEITGLQGIDYQREMITASANDDALMLLVEKRREVKTRMDEAVAEYDDISQEAWRKILMLDNNDHVRVLTFRYIKNCKWEHIANEIGCSVDYARKELLKSALLAFYDKMNPEDKAPRSI